MPKTAVPTPRGTRLFAASAVLRGFSAFPVARQLAQTIALTSASDTAMIEEAITAGRFESTVQRASTVVIDLLDPDGKLLNSRLCTQASSLTIASRAYDLVRVSSGTDDVRTLTFEPAAVGVLRRRKGRRVWKSGTVSRLQAMQAMCRESNVRLWTPRTAPTPVRRQKPAASPAAPVETPGFGKGARVTVKRVAATQAQRKVLDQVLAAAWRYTARYPADVRRLGLVMTVMAITQESTVKYDATPDKYGSYGWFQQTPPAYKNMMDIDLATRDFLFNAPERPAAFEVLLKHRDRSLGWCISEAQRDYTWRRNGGPPQGKDFDQWRTEAERTVQTWLGGVKVTDTPRVALASKRGPYEREAGESSWDALSRLAEEIQLRCFEQAGGLVISDDLSLMARQPDILVTPTEPWLLDFTFDHDPGLPAAEARVEGMFDATRIMHGRSCDVAGYGAADGRWLISDVTQGLFDVTGEITLTRPQPVLPEPETTSTVTDRARPAITRTNTTMGSALAAGADAGVIVGAVFAEALAISNEGKGYGASAHGAGGWAASRRAPSQDCSSSTSLALHAAGLMAGQSGVKVSDFFLKWGRPGKGRLFTVWVKRGTGSNGHVWIEFHHLPGRYARFDTGGHSPIRGARVVYYPIKDMSPYVPRHWPGC